MRVLHSCGVLCYNPEQRQILLVRNLNTPHFPWKLKYPLSGYLDKGTKFDINSLKIETWSEEELVVVSSWSLKSDILYGIQPPLKDDWLKVREWPELQQKANAELQSRQHVCVKWSIPKGGFEFTQYGIEDSKECALRELYEETNQKLSIEDLLSESFDIPTDGYLKDRIYVVSKAFDVHTEERQANKVNYYRWFTMEEAIQIFTELKNDAVVNLLGEIQRI